LRAENAHDKEYIVTVDKPISERFVERMSRGVPILGTITKPCIVNVKSRFVFTIILTQGLNRQIRRMCEYLDYEVKQLKRSRIMNVELNDLKPGQWRDLTANEMADINQAVQGSSKTAIDTAQPKGKEVQANQTDIMYTKYHGNKQKGIAQNAKEKAPNIGSGAKTYAYTPIRANSASASKQNEDNVESTGEHWPFKKKTTK
jgi:23S rRNA pseudouridine2604 synthase